MAHQLFCITGSKQYNITPITGSVSWKSSTDQLGVQLDFEDAYNDDRYFPVNPVDIGSMIILTGEAEIFRGIAVTEQKNGRGAIQYTAFDPAFYLNQSKETYQFKAMPADQAIAKVLTDAGVPIGSIVAMSTPITKIYSGAGLADIIKDILAQVETTTGVKHRMEMRAGKLYIELQTDLVISPTFSLASNLAPVSVTAAISNPVRKRSIESMRNSIVITCNDQVIYTVQDPALIQKYGQLQEVQSVDQNKVDSARITAANLLKDLGKIMEDNSLELPGSDEARAGRLIPITEPITGMSGNYLIKEVTNTDKGGIYTMQLSLEVP